MTELKSRDQINPADKWAVEDIYVSDELWQTDFDELRPKLVQIQDFKGKLSSAKQLKAALDLYFDLSRQLDKIYTYTHLKLDEDTTNASYQDKRTRAQNLYVDFMKFSSFIQPEIINLGSEKITTWLDEDQANLQTYRKILLDLLDEAPHTLPDREMQLLAGVSGFGDSASTIYHVFSDADLKFPQVTNDKGELQDLTVNNFTTLLQSQQRSVRQQTYETLYQTLANYQNTLASTLQGTVQKSTWYAKTLNFSSNREYRMFNSRIPETVYDNLTSTVNQNLDLLHNYTQFRQQTLGVDKLYFYDNYYPLFKFDQKYSFEQAQALIIEALKPMGDEYCQIIQKAFAERWIDKYENRNKRSGAYSSGCYDSKPYILMSFNHNIDSVFTLAHELGHSVHSYLTNSNQPYHYSDYQIFVAEVASIFNEILLIQYLLNKSSNQTEKQFLLNHFLDLFHGTVFRQTMFAEFELKLHQKVEAGETLTSPAIKQIYRELLRRYFGPAIEVDDLIALEWARIPHFHSPFYVYQYATGFAAAAALSQKVLSGEATAVENYLQFLKTGSSKSPITALKIAGVDMTTPQPIQKSLDLFAQKLAQLKQLV